MPLDFVMSGLMISVTFIIALIISYQFFDNSFNYLLYFEVIFLLVFISFNIIDYYYMAIVILILALIIYRAIEPELKKSDEK